MRELWFIAVLSLSFGFFYTTLVNDTCNFTAIIDVLAMRTFMFMLLYIIAKIYVYHVMRIYNSRNVPLALLLNFSAVVLPLIIAIMIIETHQCNLKVSFIPLVILLFLLTLLVDFKGKIGDRIIEFYESKLGGRHSDMFLQYPPKSLGDIIFHLLFVLIIVVIISLL